MMNRLNCFTNVLLVVCVSFAPAYAQEVENLLENGGFEDGDVAPWSQYGGATLEVVQELVGAAVPEGPIEGASALHVEVAGAGVNSWSTGLQHLGHVLEQGKVYTLSVFLKCDEGTLETSLMMERAVDPWEKYPSLTVTMTEEWVEYSITGPLMTATVDPAAITFHIAFAAGDFWVDGVRFYEGEYVPPSFQKRVGATDPSPAASVQDVPRDAEFGWVAGVFANTHNVYFGSIFADVNAASVDNPMGVLASQGQSDATFQPAGTLDFSQTYYWRVDEVNAAPDQTVFPGPVWAFTTEAFSDPSRPIGVTASSSHSAAMEPDGIIDGSGLNAADLHNIVSADMWLSATTDSAPWVQFEFDRAYRLHEMWIWNSNQGIETVIGFGSQDVVVELSTDGENWTALDGVPKFAQAPGLDNYTHNTTVDFGEAVAQFVRLTITSGWGPLSQVGLSEVRFFFIPTYAREPQPADGSTTDGADVTLEWRKGRDATSHQVVMSSDMALVEDHSAVAGTPADNSFPVPGLNYGGTYYWRINEIDEASASTFEGDVWSFMTPEWLSVDDFENYRDEEFFEIWSIWIDGFGDEANNGAIVGNLNEAERGIVQEGRQSMPLHYDNTSAPVSSATRTFDTPQDWTPGFPEILSVHFRGNADNGASPIYLVVADSSGKEAVVTHPDAAATVTTNWTAWETSMADLGGINLSSVSSVTFGVGVPGGSQASGAQGTLFIDNLRIGTTRP